MTRKGDFVLRRLADEYVLIPYGATSTLCKGAWVLCQLLLDGGGLAVLTGVQLLHRGDCGAAWKSLRCAGGGSAGGCQRGAENISELRDPGVRNLRK